MIIRSRIVHPISSPPISNGAVWVVDGQIRAVGPWKTIQHSCSGPVLDLGECLLLPGWVNAHCHLDYTHMAGQLPMPRSFPDWIKCILTAKSGWNPDTYLNSWLSGARQLLESGTTTVANIESVPPILARARAATALRVHSYLELTGVRSQRSDADILAEALDALQQLPCTRGALGLSPHAPYSTRPSLLQNIARANLTEPWPLTIHVGESREEFEMFMYQRGPMFDWLRSQRDMSDCGLGSPVQHLNRCGLLSHRTLAVHANYLWDNDAELLAQKGVAVVHCPRSHAYFGHQRFPRRDLVRAGVPIGLGTDSLASVRTQDRGFVAGTRVQTPVAAPVTARSSWVMPSFPNAPRGGNDPLSGEVRQTDIRSEHSPEIMSSASRYTSALFHDPGPPTLSMFAECQTLLGRDSGLSPDEVLRMGTVGSAQAMGLTGRVGEIIPGAWADLAAIPFHGSLTDAAAAWVHHGGPVGATLIHGRWEWVQPGFASMDVPS